MDPHNKTTKGTHTHTAPRDPKTSSQVRASLVPVRDLSDHPLLGHNKPNQGEDSAPEPSSCGPRSPFGEGERVPVIGEDANWYHFL